MTTEEIAKKLCAHCRNHTEAQGLEELYAETAESIEAMSPEGQSPVSKGRDAIQAKHDWWAETMEVHSFDLEGPFVHDNQFAVVFDIDCTEKASGQRWKSKEVGLYEVFEGKIVKESFFMAPMG